jgi:phosphatidylglycerophosphate synthase
MMNTKTTDRLEPDMPGTWDGRMARRLVRPLRDSRVTPNHLTTVRLATGMAGAVCLAQGGFAWANAGALLVVLSNFIDHTDGELARISGKSSRFGHFYDLASDALVTVALFVSMGICIAGTADSAISPVLLGAVAGVAVALIFLLRMRIEELAGKVATRQAAAGGFETEDVLYLLPIVTLTDVVSPFLMVAAIGAPLFALWTIMDYRRVARRARPAPVAAAAPKL